MAERATRPAARTARPARERLRQHAEAAAVPNAVLVGGTEEHDRRDAERPCDVRRTRVVTEEDARMGEVRDEPVDPAIPPVENARPAAEQAPDQSVLARPPVEGGT